MSLARRTEALLNPEAQPGLAGLEPATAGLGEAHRFLTSRIPIDWRKRPLGLFFA